jgi:hypothetical protein
MLHHTEAYCEGYHQGYRDGITNNTNNGLQQDESSEYSWEGRIFMGITMMH